MFLFELTVAKENIDFNNHVNNLEYLKWAQKISKLHWESAASAEFKDTYWWIISRQEIDYLQELKLGDLVLLKTWIQNTHKHKSERVVEMYAKNTNTLVAKVIITWTLLLKETNKPVRIPENIIAIFNPA